MIHITRVLAAFIIPGVMLLEGLTVNWPFAVFIGVFPFSFIFAIAYLYQRAALQDVIAASAPGESPLPLPMELVPARIPKMHIFIGVAILVGGTLMIWGVPWPGKSIPALVTLIFVAVVVHAFHKERAILRNRAFALGQVFERTFRRRASLITYTFKDDLGNEVQGTAQDYSLIYDREMNVPVFYDRTRPRYNLPISGFFVYKLVQPHERA